MPTINQFRALIPGGDKMSDYDIVQEVSKTLGWDEKDVAAKLRFGASSGGITSQQISSSIDRYQAGLYGVAEEVAGAVGAKDTSSWLEKQRTENELRADIAAQKAQKMGAVDSWENVHGLGDFGSYAKSLGIQSAPYLAEALVGGVGGRLAMGGTRAALAAAEASGDVAAAARAKRALSLGSDAGVVAASYPSSVGDVLSNQREQSGTTDAASAFALGIPYAALNVVGLEGALGKGQLFRNPLNLLDNVSGLKGGLARTAATGTTAAFKEGAQETAQEFINQAGRMAVDPTEQFFNEKSNERFKESFIGGATLGGLIGGGAGGWRRSEGFVAGANTGTSQQTGQQSTNDIQQTFQQTTTGTTPTAIPVNRFAEQMGGTTDRADPLAGRSSLYNQQPAAEQTAPITPAAPAVSGGTTDIAQAQAAANQQQQQQTQAEFTAQQQQKEAERAEFMAQWIGLPKPTTDHWDFFGKPIFGPAAQEAAVASAAQVSSMNATQAQITRAINIANNQTGGKLVNVNFNPLKAADSVRKTFEKVAEAAARFQIAHVGSVEEAAQILEQLSQSTKGAQLEQLNAIHQALTGEDTSGYTASQQTKGATNGLQLQTTTGMGTVPIESGTGEGGGTNAGDVQPSRLQSLISGSQPQGQTGQQAGQLSGEGIRNGTSVTSDISGGQPASGQVNEQAPTTQTTTGQAAPVAISETPSESGIATAELDQGITTEEGYNSLESKLGKIPEVMRNVLRMVFPKARPQTIELYATFASQKAGFNEQTQSYEELAEALNKMFPNEKPIMASTIKDHVNKSLKLDENGVPLFVARERAKIAAAAQFQANKAGVSVESLLSGLTSALKIEIEFSEENGTTDEIDLILNGMQIQNRSERTNAQGEKTGKSDRTNVTNIVDETNESDTLNQRYLNLVGEMEQALKANDEPRIAKLQTEIADVVQKIKKEVKLEEGRTRAKAGKVKTEKEEKTLTGEVNAVGEDIGERATTPETEEKVEAEPKEKLAEEEVEVEEEEEAKPKPLGEKLAEEAAAKRKADRKGLNVGDTVVNPKLGTGVVESFAGDGAETTVTVKFQNGLTKTLSVASAKLEKTNAVQEQGANEGNVRQPAGGGEAVGKGNAKPEKPARKAKQAKVEEDRPEIKEQRSTLERLLPKQIGGMTLESITPYSGNWTVKYGSENASGMRSSQNVPIDADMLVGKSDAEISKLLYERMAKNGLKEKVTQTPAEAAEVAWNKVADTMPSAPKFADLTKQQQENFIDFGPENWTEADVTLELIKLAKAAPAATTPKVEKKPAPVSRAAVTAKTVLDTNKFVYHAVRSDEDLEAIMRDGVAPGTNVSTSHDGQAFAGEGDTILVLPKDEAGAKAKGYQQDSITSTNVFPVAILKDDSLLSTEGNTIENELLNEEEEIRNSLLAFDKTLGITEEQRNQAIAKAEVGNKDVAKQLFGEFYDRIMKLSRRQDSVWDELDRVERLNALPTLESYNQYGLPVFALNIQYNEATDKVKLKVKEKVEAAPATEIVTEKRQTIEDITAQETEDTERFEREMRAAASNTPSGNDVKTTGLRFVPFSVALDIAKRAVAEGVPLNWVQFHSQLDLTADSANRLVEALGGTPQEAAAEELTAEEIIEESPEAAEINPEQQAILEEPVAALPEAQVARLENHYGVKRGTSEFFTKLQEDVTAYATKGAQAVAAAIRDIVKAIHAGVLATAMIFNPSVMTKNSEVVIVAPRTVSQVREVRAEVPAVAKANMSKAAQEAYSTIYPSIAAKLKADNKFFVLTDKPNARMFIFNPDGSLFLQKKVLVGKTVGDYYKGNTDIVQNRITPAGLFTMGLRDAKRGGGEARTAGGYDFGKVFVLDKAIDGEYSVTLFHSVWTKEKDAQQRLAALQKEGAADSRYSFGCINVDKATYGSLVANNLQQMDGAALFIVPDKQELVGEFLTGATAQNKSNKDELTRTPFTPKTETVTTTTPAPASGQATSSKVSVIGREEQGPLASRGTFLDFGELESKLAGMDLVREQLREAGIEHALDYVSDWTLESDTSQDAWHGSLEAVNGRYVGSLNVAKLGEPKYAAMTARHEISHAVDMAPHGGIYSAQPEMGVLVSNGKITPTGAVAEEMFALYQSDEDWKKFLAYPFDTKLYPELNNGTKIQIELFAQIMAVYTSPVGRAYLEAVAPKTAAYLKEVVNDIKSTKSLQIQKAEVAALRAVSFQNRNQPGRNQAAGGLPPKNRVRQETGPLAAKGTGLSLDQTFERMPPFVRTPTRNLVTGLLHQAKNAIYASAITEDVVKLASKYMKSANDYLNAQYARQGTRIQFEQRINKILSDFDKLSGEYKGTGANSVNKFIKDSTVSGKWGYYPGEHRVGTELFTVDPEMEKRFNAIEKESPAAAQVIKDVFEHGYEALMLKKKAVEAAIDREFADREKAVMGDSDQMAELAKEKKLLLAREAKIRGIDVSSPYAYLGRYGDYVVVAKSAEFKHYEERAKLNDWDVKQAKQWLQDNISNADHYVVQFAETQAEADAIADQLHATGNYDIMPEDAGVKEAEESYTGGGDIHLAVSRLRNLLQRQVSDGDMSSANFHSMNKMVGDLYLMTVAESSARKSLLQRKNVAGADDNMMRNLATSGRADAHFLSTLEHNDAITDSMERMRTEAKNHRREAMPIYNELVKRQANSMEYKSPSVLSVALNRMNTLWSLTFSPAFYLQQLTQTAVISVPYLAGRLGYSNAVSQVNRGYKDITGLVKGLGVNDHIDFSKAPADVRDMLNKLVGMGKIDISMDAHERATADEKGIFAKVMYKMQGVNNRIEAVNRSVAAIAAYRGYLARYGNNNTEAATQYAAQVVSDTHGSYDGFNTPRALAGNFGRVVGQFRRFQIIQLSMLARLMNNAFKGASSDEKMVARKALGFITAQMAVIGGAMAVPFFNQIAWMMSKILGEPDEPDDFEFKLRRLINNKVVADLLLRGVPASLGVDVSDKLGMGRVASILPFAQGDLTSRSGAEKILVAAMGPSANMSMKFADAFGMVLKGDYYKGLEMAMPNGVANVMKAGRFATEGITMRNGDLVLKPEDFGMVDAAFQAMGLPTNTVTDRQFTQQVKAEYDQLYAQKSTDIKGEYVKAYRENDAKGMARAREEFQQLEDSRVANGYKRQPMSDLLKAPMAAMKRERGVIGGVETSKQNKRFVELASQI